MTKFRLVKYIYVPNGFFYGRDYAFGIWARVKVCVGLSMAILNA